MTHLVCRANYDDEYGDVEFFPTHFVMEIDDAVIAHLNAAIEKIKQFGADNPDFFKSEFYFGFGVWTEFNELLEDTFQEGLEVSSKINELFDEDTLIEHNSIESCRIEVYSDGDFRFSCYGKYNGEKVYTCILSIDELQKEK